MKYIYLTVILIVMLTACNPAATTAPALAANETEAPFASSTPIPFTPTPSPIATQELPTGLPGLTATALPTLRPGQALILASLHMVDEQNGWGIDASEHILRTTDGGNTWKDVTPHNGAYQSSGFFALDANTAWATPYQKACYVENCPPPPTRASVWHTLDGGNTWQAGGLCIWVGPDCSYDFDVPPEYYQPVALQFVDTRTGWLLVSVEHLMFQDRYLLYHTQDGGAHWSISTDNMKGPMTNNVTGLAFQDQQTGWMSLSDVNGAVDPTADWSIVQTTDAGLTWNLVSLPAPESLPKAFANNTVWCGGTGVATVPPGGVGMTIQCEVLTDPMSYYDFYFHSSDDGRHWTSWLKTGDVDFIDPKVGWRLTFDSGAYDLEQTHDGGRIWMKIKTVAWNGDLEFVNEQTGWAIATNDTVALVHTIDGGRTWQQLKPAVVP